MGFEGTFSRIISQKALGSPAYSFTIKNTNIFKSETIDLVISDAHGKKQWFFRQQKLQYGQTFRLDIDTVNWEWCNGDYCALLGKNDTIKKHWTLNIPHYGPGECPECHGTHKCRNCKGEGYNLNKHTIEISQCPYCGGSGICMTCFVPERRLSPTFGNYGSTPAPPSQSYLGSNNPKNSAKIQAINSEISSLQSKINQVDWDIKMMQLNDSDLRNNRAFVSLLHLRNSYQNQLVRLQQQLQNYL